MFINATGFYVPEERVDNSYFYKVNGLTSEWIYQRTGILTRSKAKPEENVTTMGMEAVKNALPKLPYDITEVDLIISASYSPYDTVATTGHVAQQAFNIQNAKVLYLSSACSSFINALEVVEGYFAMGKATKALIISADKNSAYSNEHDPKAGHLWGDAAAAFFISKEAVTEKDPKILEIYTEGLGHIGNGPEGLCFVLMMAVYPCLTVRMYLFRHVLICLRMQLICWDETGTRLMILRILLDIRQTCVLCPILQDNSIFRKRSFLPI